MHKNSGKQKKFSGANHMVIRVIIMAALAMAVIDGIVVSIALPTMTRVFSVDIAQSQWIFTAYLVTETSLLLIFGRVSEFTGKHRLFLAGLILFTTSSLACGLSLSLWELVIFRALQAAGSAMIFSICVAILYETSEPGEQGKVMGYIGTTIAAAAVAAPVLGGVVTGSLGWEYIFFINVPIGVVGIILFLLLSPPGIVSRETFSMDWPGAAALGLFLVFLVLFLAEVSSGQMHPQGVTLFFFLAILSLFFFIQAEKRSSCPLLNLSLLQDPHFLLPNMSLTCVYIAFFMLYFVGPFYLEVALGIKPLGVGFVFLVIPVIIIIGSPVAGILYDRWNAKTLPAFGIAITGISLLFLSFAVVGQDIMLIIATFIPLSLGISLFLAPNATEIMRSLPLERASLASSLSATLKNLGMITGVSLSALLLSLDLSAHGYSMSLQNIDPVILTYSIQKILVIGSVFCAIGTSLSLISNRLQCINNRNGP